MLKHFYQKLPVNTPKHSLYSPAFLDFGTYLESLIIEAYPTQEAIRNIIDNIKIKPAPNYLIFPTQSIQRKYNNVQRLIHNSSSARQGRKRDHGEWRQIIKYSDFYQDLPKNLTLSYSQK